MVGNSGKKDRPPSRAGSPRPGRDSTSSPGSGNLLEPRERIYEALLDLCFEQRFEQIELGAMLERAELDEQAFHSHFADLEDCFCKKLEIEREAFFAAIDRALQGQVVWVDRLRAVAYALLDFLVAEDRRRHFLTTELNEAGERARRIWTETIVRPLFDLIDEGRGERPQGSHQSRATAGAIGGAVFYQLSLAAERGDLDQAAIPALMYSAVLPYLGPEAAARELSIPPPVRARSPGAAASKHRSE